MLYLCDQFFIFSLIFVLTNHTIALKQTTLFFVHFLESLLLFLDHNMDEESEQFLNSKSSSLACCLAFDFLCVAYKRKALTVS